MFSTTGRTPSSGFNHALDRVIAAMSAKAGREIPHFTIHDLRRSTATGMAELEVSEHIVDRTSTIPAARSAAPPGFTIAASTCRRAKQRSICGRDM